MFFYVLGQNDSTVHHLDPIDIVAPSTNKMIISPIPMQTLHQSQHRILPLLQLSDAIKLMSGAVIKDYGGVGGMKTVSIRGLGSQHTGVIYDGIALTDCQTGQIDLGKFAIENLETITLEVGSENLSAQPARQFAQASTLKFTMPIPKLDSSKPFSASLRFVGGSFGLLNPSISIQNLWNPNAQSQSKYFSTFYFSYLRSRGDYPFLLHYGGSTDSVSRERRINSAVQRLSAETNLFALFTKQSSLKIKLFYNLSEQELPGAVTFYNPKNAQKLWDQNLFTQLSYDYNILKLHYQLNAKFNYAYQRYLDAHYLNAVGKIDNHYLQNEYYISNSFMYKPYKVIYFSFANDLIYNNMKSDMADFVYPTRFTILNLITTNISISHFKISAGILQTAIQNWTKESGAADPLHRISPAFNCSYQPFRRKQFFIRFFYKDIFRSPTFNDLYYRLVGNVNLKPEQTHQLNLGTTYFGYFPIQKLSLSVSVDGYYNRVKDKIVAFPGKDLFVWTMLNFGRVDIWGIDLNLQNKYQITPNIIFNLASNYSFQHATDCTDPFSRTYGHQIPYTPRHSGAITIMLQIPWVDIAYSMLFSGKRYALQQNIPANLLPGYIDQSIAISREFRINCCYFEAKLELLNIANVQYEVIKNYPMQGRSIRCTFRIKY